MELLILPEKLIIPTDLKIHSVLSPKKLLKNGFFMKWPSFFGLFLNLYSFFKPFRKCFAKKLQTLESNEIQKMEVKPLNYDTCKPNLVPFVCNQA